MLQGFFSFYPSVLVLFKDLFQVKIRLYDVLCKKRALEDIPAQLRTQPSIAQLVSVEGVLCRTELFMGLQKSAVKIPTPHTVHTNLICHILTHPVHVITSFYSWRHIRAHVASLLHFRLLRMIFNFAVSFKELTLAE